MQKRNATIQFYDSFEYIQEFKEKGITPRNDSENRLHAFYIRNLEEQQKIINHLLHNTKKRALLRSKTSLFDYDHFMSDFYDRPYQTALPFGEKYFDHRKIDKVGHRLLTVLVSQAKGLKQLYETDKEAFYNELIKLCPFESVITDIEYFLTMLTPLSNSRKDLFSELIELFRTEKFYGFYSLALSQVEGLFSEMLDKINPKAKKPSLSTKSKSSKTFS